MPRQDNREKAIHGDEFNNMVLKVLRDLKAKNYIDNIEMKKKVPFSLSYRPQFHAPFLVEKGDNKLLIFKTNSMRSDRNKENQWDAFGIKNYFGQNLKAIVVLPSNLSNSEEASYLREKEKIKQEGYYSSIDEICRLDELENILKCLMEFNG